MDTLIAHKIDIKSSNILRHMKVYYIVIKVSTRQKDITIISIYKTTIRALNK